MRAREWAGRLLTAITLSLCLTSQVSAQRPACVGDCDDNRIVSVDELVRGVSIALNRQAVSTCTAFDPNESSSVTVNELVQGVNSALRGCFPPVSFRGLCRLPAASGLVPCSAGSAVRLSLCLNRARCLFDPSARRLLRSGLIGADGRFFFSVDDEAILNALLLLESDVVSGVTYRALAFGPAAAGASIDDFDVDPINEAIARLFVTNGLDQFSDLSISDIIGIVANALASLNFGGLTPNAAADLAENTANQNPAVQQAVNSRRFTPTVTHTVTSTATQAVSATPTATPTITPTPTITSTPTSTFTGSTTATQTSTAAATASFTASATVTNTSTITATPTITPTASATSSPTATLPPLNLALEVNPDPVRPGETTEVSFIVTNTGGSPIGPLSLEMVLPSFIDPFSDGLASDNGRCGVQQTNTCDPGDTLTWSLIGSLAPGEGITLRVPPIVAAGTPNGTMLTFTGTVGAPGHSTTKSYSTVVQSGIPFPYDLALNQESDPVGAGELLTYTIAFGFRAVVGQADTVLRVQPPAGTAFVGATDGGAPNQSGEVEWSLGTLTPGDGGVRRFTVALDDDLPQGRILQAQAIIERSDATATKRANAVNRVQAEQPIGLVMETNPDPARPGENVETSITLTNPSDTAQTVLLYFIVPDQVDIFTDANVTGNGTCGPFTPGSPCERRARVRWSLTVPPRDGVTVRADPIVSAAAVDGALINFQARLVNPQGSYIASARRAVRVDEETIWDFHLDEDRDPVVPDSIYRYRLTLRHRPTDPSPVDGIIDLTLPSDVTVLDTSDGGVVANGAVEWTLGSLASNAVVTREITVQIDNDTAPATVLVAEARLRDQSNALAAKRARTLTRVALGSPIALSAVVHPDPVRPGEVMQTELTVTNNAAQNISGVRYEVRVPDGTDAFAAALSNGAFCSNVTLQCAPRELARWNTSVLSPGGMASIQLPPIVNAATADGTLLRLHARASDLGATSRDSVISRTIIVDSDTPFDLGLTESRDPTIPGETLAYTLHFGRRAMTAASDAILRLQLPAGAFFVSSPDGGALVGDDIVEWDLGALAAGADGSRHVNVVVDALLEGTPLHARAIIADGDDATTEKRAEAVTVVGAPALVFALTVTPDSVEPGDSVTVSLALTNTGTTTLNNLIIEGIVPPQANAFQDTATTGGGICGPIGTCNPRARVIFPIPTVAGGQTVTVTMPPMIRADVPPGTVVRLLGWFQQNISTSPVIATGAVTVTAGP